MLKTHVVMALSVLVLACGEMPPAVDGGPNTGGGGGAPIEVDAGTGGGGGSMVIDAGACIASAVPCVDQSVSELDLFDTVNDAGTLEEGVTSGEFQTFVDARGKPAMGTTPTQSYVYAKFTSAGLTHVEISDEQAFDSTAWDIAFRRYIIRVNSGVSGPSCVTAANTGSTDFATVTTVAPSLSFNPESYFSATCEPIRDSGLGAPVTVLSSWWAYESCVQTTGNVFVLSLADGRHVKLQVLRYYNLEADQSGCNAGTTMYPAGSAMFHVRWAFL